MVLGFSKNMNVYGKIKPTNFEHKIKNGIKLHTIRHDVNDRWFKGRKIHYATDARSAKYNCFKEGFCTGIQKIAIESHFVSIDDRMLDSLVIEELAINDGFDSMSDFWAWFDQYEPFEGKLIHWSNLRY